MKSQQSDTQKNGDWTSKKGLHAPRLLSFAVSEGCLAYLDRLLGMRRLSARQHPSKCRAEQIADDVIKFVWAVGPEGIDIPGQCPLHVNVQSYDHFFGWLKKIVLTSGKPLRNFNVEMADGSTALRFHDGAAVPLNMLANRLTQLGILDCRTDSRLSIVGNGAMGRVGFEWKQARLFSISARIAGVDILVHDRSNTWIFSSNAYIGRNGIPWQRMPGKRA